MPGSPARVAGRVAEAETGVLMHWTAEKPFERGRPRRVYRLYGLCLRSQWPLPCLEGTGSSLAEVELFEGPASLFSAGSQEAARRSDRDEWSQDVPLPDGSYYLRWSGLFEFLISADGRRIAGQPLAEVSDATFHTYLLGQVLAVALVNQGIEPLHATVVVVDGRAVGFIGDCGYGKSTLGAAFLQAGHPLLTDDLLVMEEKGEGFSAYPSPPRIKLFPEIAKHLLGERVNGSPMNHLTPKLIIPLDRPLSCQAPVPLKAIYVLGRPTAGSRGDAVRIRRLFRRRAFLELLKNTFCRTVTDPERLKRQFCFATRLASGVPVKSLSYPRTLTSLPSVREAVLLDLRR